MESAKKWNNTPIEKQYQYNTELCQIVVEDMRMELEDWFGKQGRSVPEKLEDVVRKGEKKIDM